MTSKVKTSTLHVETGPIGRTLLAFAIPVIVSQLLQEFYNIADCAVIGHFAGGHALAAVGVSGLILSVLVNFFIGFSSGVSVITSRLFGEYSYDQLIQNNKNVFDKDIYDYVLKWKPHWKVEKEFDLCNATGNMG